MKTLIIAATFLSIGVGTAFAEGGDTYEWAYSPNEPVTAGQSPRGAIVARPGSAAITGTAGSHYAVSTATGQGTGARAER